MVSESESEARIRIPPAEIITEILYRLPAKSLGRFRCVSKSWLSLISDPQFIKTHQKILDQNHLILDHSYHLYSQPFNNHEEAELTPTKFHLELDGYLYRFCFRGSCDGLVLVSNVNKDESSALVILNPTTRESLKLPQDLGDDYEFYHDYSDTFDMYGFGYDSLSDDYKVVAIRFLYTYPDPNSAYLHVYSLRTNSWRQVFVSPYNYFHEAIMGVFVNGFIHWFAIKGSDDLIVAFSLANECFSEVPLPNDVKIVSNMRCKLFVLCGKLAVFQQEEGVIWLMNEYGVKESWTKILIHGFNEIQMGVTITFDVDNGKILLADSMRTLIYDLEERSLSKNVYDWESKNFSITGTFVESLVSLKTN